MLTPESSTCARMVEGNGHTHTCGYLLSHIPKPKRKFKVFLRYIETSRLVSEGGREGGREGGKKGGKKERGKTGGREDIRKEERKKGREKERPLRHGISRL